MSQPQPDLEKQQSADGESLPSSPRLAPALSESEPEVEEKAARREPSTKFAPAISPRYTGAGEKDGQDFHPAAPTRTFSRRQKSENDQFHIFGGDSSAAKRENDLERFTSQKGKDQVVVHWEGDDDPENPQVSL